MTASAKFAFKNLSAHDIPASLLDLPFGEIAWCLGKEGFASLKPLIEKDLFAISSSREDILLSLQYALTFRISKIIMPSFTTEMKLLSLSGQLKSDNARARYLEFVAFALDENFLTSLFNRYPLLFQSIESTISYWIRVVLEFFERLSKDFEEIQRHFFNATTLKLNQIYMDLSDLHNEGRTVFQLEFEEFRLIYKPRDLSVEKAFNDLLAEINDLGVEIGIKPIGFGDRSLKIIDDQV